MPVFVALLARRCQVRGVEQWEAWMVSTSACPKCGGAMVAGFIVDQGYGEAHVTKWQSGEPKRSFWTGVKQSKSQQIETTTYRCESCGYLETYAHS
jgi:predicted RNA-binding Zn-ribbon protein involved in translation (DUF1610 family)